MFYDFKGGRGVAKVGVIIYIYIGNSNPNWRTPSFFRGVETQVQFN